MTSLKYVQLLEWKFETPYVVSYFFNGLIGPRRPWACVIFQMNSQVLMETARALVADHKGLLAMDESNPTCNK